MSILLGIHPEGPIKGCVKTKVRLQGHFPELPKWEKAYGESFQGHTNKPTNAYARQSPEKHGSPHSFLDKALELKSKHKKENNLGKKLKTYKNWAPILSFLHLFV